MHVGQLVLAKDLRRDLPPVPGCQSDQDLSAQGVFRLRGVRLHVRDEGLSGLHQPPQLLGREPERLSEMFPETRRKTSPGSFTGKLTGIFCSGKKI